MPAGALAQNYDAVVLDTSRFLSLEAILAALDAADLVVMPVAAVENQVRHLGRYLPILERDPGLGRPVAGLENISLGLVNLTGKGDKEVGVVNLTEEIHRRQDLVASGRDKAGPWPTGEAEEVLFLVTQAILYPGGRAHRGHGERGGALHPHRNQVALEAKKRAGEDDVEITLDDLVKNGLRMAMRRMLLGKFRGKGGLRPHPRLRHRSRRRPGDGAVHANDLFNAVGQIAVMMLYANTPLNADL